MKTASADVAGFDVTAYTNEMPVQQESQGCLLRRRDPDGGMAIWFENTKDGVRPFFMQYRNLLI